MKKQITDFRTIPCSEQLGQVFLVDVGEALDEMCSVKYIVEEMTSTALREAVSQFPPFPHIISQPEPQTTIAMIGAKKKKKKKKPGTVAQVCNHSYSRSRDQKALGSRPAQAKS
jgi:hypothetical protein